MATKDWVRVNKANPCPICKKTTWCSVSADGTTASCKREQNGSYKTKQDKNGSPFYLHRLKDGPRPVSNNPPRRPAGPAPKLADVDTLHEIYSAFLAKLQLWPKHCEALLARKLTDEVIRRNGYKTLPLGGRHKVAQSLREQFGDKLLKVPGFIVKDGDRGPYVTIAGSPGILIPVRDIQGRIIALKIRLDDPDDGCKYRYLSSANHAGPSPGAPAHVPLGITSPTARIRATEGELKSDIAFALSGIPTISAPGVGNWTPCVDVLKSLG
jgi:hypothetical protein